MRRIAVLAVAFVVLAGGLMLLTPALLPKDRVRTEIAEQISAWTGREVAVSGEPVISVFPGLRVRIDGVAVAGPPAMRNAELAQMRGLTAKLRLLPLLIGKIEFAAFELTGARIRLVRDEADRRNWVFDSSVAALQLAFTGDVPLGSFSLVDGQIDYEDRQAKRRERLEAVNLKIDWPSVDHPFALSGSATWRGEPISFQAGMRDPVSFINGRQTPFTARLRAEPMDIDFDGTAAGIKNTRLGGQLELASPSLRRFVGWIGNPLPEAISLARLTLSGEAMVDSKGLDVSDARVSLDGNEGTGGLRIGFGEQPLITGTLAFQSLDLEPYLTDLETLRSSPDWQSETIDVDWLRVVNADIRVSSGKVTAGRLSLGETATAILLEDGVLETGIAQASFYGGTLTGRLSLRAPSGGAAMQAQLRASAFSLAAAGRAVNPDLSISGQSSVAGDLSTFGATWGDLIAHLDGTVMIDAAGGEISSFGLEELAAAMRAGKPAATSAGSKGPWPAMAYRSLAASLQFGNRAALVTSGRLETAGFLADLGGKIALQDGALDLAGTMTLPSAGMPQQSFNIVGTLLLPELQASGGN